MYIKYIYIGHNKSKTKYELKALIWVADVQMEIRNSNGGHDK